MKEFEKYKEYKELSQELGGFAAAVILVLLVLLELLLDVLTGVDGKRDNQRLFFTGWRILEINQHFKRSAG